jgi:hypothetical protein
MFFNLRSEDQLRTATDWHVVLRELKDLIRQSLAPWMIRMKDKAIITFKAIINVRSVNKLVYFRNGYRYKHETF